MVIDPAGNVHFNRNALGPQARLKKFQDAAAALAIPFPPGEETPIEERLKIQSQIFERIYRDAIDAALAAR
jgi:hypothetical protein